MSSEWLKKADKELFDLCSEVELCIRELSDGVSGLKPDHTARVFERILDLAAIGARAARARGYIHVALKELKPEDMNPVAHPQEPITWNL